MNDGEYANDDYVSDCGWWVELPFDYLHLNYLDCIAIQKCLFYYYYGVHFLHYLSNYFCSCHTDIAIESLYYDRKIENFSVMLYKYQWNFP